MQAAALSILSADHARQEAEAIRVAFRKKRDKMVDGLRRLGVRFEREPEGTFYAWGNLSNLPAPLNTGDGLFQAALDHKIITVPGHFFDVDPGGRRVGRSSRFRHHARFSFGPNEAVIDKALSRLSEMVSAAR
jgi:aspartate/methionine/tyrosine aminotransferase